MSRGKEKIIQTQFLRHYKNFYFFFSTSWLSSYSYFAIRFRERKRNTFFFKIFAVASGVAVQIRNILLFFGAENTGERLCMVIRISNSIFYMGRSSSSQTNMYPFRHSHRLLSFDISPWFFSKVADLIFLSS